MSVRVAVLAALALSACSSAPGGAQSDWGVCTPAGGNIELDRAVRETSGLARSRHNPDIIWTHNDSGDEPRLYALDQSGAVRARVAVSGARAIDWEDLEIARCESGNCLYIADTGDNAERRDALTIYEVPEPTLDQQQVAPSRVLTVRYPEGPQDAEALFADGNGNLYIVTKGRHAAIRLYRVPLRGAETTALELMRELAPKPERGEDWSTAATMSADGRWVGVRTYRTLWLYRAEPLLRGEPVQPLTVDLRPLRERQGEAIIIDADGTIWLSSEAETTGLPTLRRLSCRLPD